MADGLCNWVVLGKGQVLYETKLAWLPCLGHHGEWRGLKGVDLFFKFSVGKGSSISSFVKFLINNFLKGGGIFIYSQAVGGSVHSSDPGYSSICALLYIIQNVWVFDKETMFGEKM